MDNVGNNVGNTVDDKIFFRKFGQPDNELYMKKDGKDVRVDVNGDYFKSIIEKDNCFTIGVADANKVNCNELIKNCLAGENIQKCKQYMTETDWWNNSKESVDNTTPEIALKLLNSFKFPISKVFVKEVNQTLIQIGNSTKWIDDLRKNHQQKEGETKNDKLSKEDIDNISKNTNLLGYLDSLATRINRNPQILNPKYQGSNLKHNPKAIEGTKFS